MNRRIGLLFYTALLPLLAFSQIQWTYEYIGPFGGRFSAMALDQNDVPHVIFTNNVSIIHTYRDTACWVEDTIINTLSNGINLVYGFSIVCDKNNKPHVCFAYRKDSLDKTYICHGLRQDHLWDITIIDSITGWLGNYFTHIYSAIDIDTMGLPGISYIAWNVGDSLHYVKYAHFNGLDWDTSVVEYDIAYANIQRGPTDWSPCLEYTHLNRPIIAFHHVYSQYDTIKTAFYNDTLNLWQVQPAILWPYGGTQISLALDGNDFPRIAHGVDAAVAYSWFDGTAWHTEYTGAGMGVVDIRIKLALDSIDNPHIAFLPEPLMGQPEYVFKRNDLWINCGSIEPESVLTIDSDISLALDQFDNPNVCYPTNYLKYAKGTILGVSDENGADRIDPQPMVLYPNPFRNKIRIAACENLKLGSQFLNIYDITGRLVKRFDLRSNSSGQLLEFYWDGKDDEDNSLPSGIYFVQVKSRGGMFTKKIIKLE